MTADTSPATTLETAYRNADPSAPLPGDHPWYVDLAEAREAIRPGLARSLRLNLSADQSGERNWERVIFVSQRGTGKTTELKRLATELRSSFEVIEVEANAELNSELFDITELLFVIALRVERHMRDVLGTPLDRRLRADLQRWFVDATHADLRTLGVDAQYMELLYRRWVLAYNDQEWFDLAPLIRDIPEVKAQLKWEPGGAA